MSAVFSFKLNTNVKISLSPESVKEHQGTLKLSQEKYFQTMTKTYGLVEAKSTKLPVLPTIKLYDDNRFVLEDKKPVHQNREF